MKKFLAVPLILVLLTAGSYGVFGIMAKKNFDSTMEQITSQIPGHIDVTYKQGFLSSTVELQSKLPMADDGVNLDISISTNHTIYHGPFVFHAMQNKQPAYIPVQAYTEGFFSYELAGDVDSDLAQSIKEASTTAISAYVPLMGDTRIQFSGAPLSKEFDIDGELLAVEWQGFTGSLLSQGSLLDFTYDFVAPGLTLSTDGPERFELGTIHSSGTGHTGSFEIGLGNHKANIKNLALTFSEEPGDHLLAEHIDINVIIDENDALLSVSEIFNLNRLSVNNKDYGPANITFHARNLDAKTLSDMNQQYMELQKTNAGDSDAMQAQLMQMASTHGLTLLSKSPEFEFETISLKTAEGGGEIGLKVRFNGEGDVIMNPLFLLGRLEAEATLGADERFLAVLAKEITKEALCTDDNDPTCDQQAARASSEQLQQLLINKQLILENDRFISSVTFKDGVATLNGTPMPLF